MIQKTDFEDIKAKILNRAKAAQACTEQYNRAYKSETLQELCSVIKDNFHWWVNNKVITSDLLIQYRKDFAKMIYLSTFRFGVGFFCAAMSQ